MAPREPHATGIFSLLAKTGNLALPSTTATWGSPQLNTHTSNPTPSPPRNLQDLPTEIRLQILKCLIPTGIAIDIVRNFRQYVDGTEYYVGMDVQERERVRIPELAVMRSCRRLYNDVLSLLYGSNSFHLPLGLASKARPPLRMNFLRCLPTDGLLLVKRLHLRVQDEFGESRRYHAMERTLEKLVQVLSSPSGHSLTQLTVSYTNFPAYISDHFNLIVFKPVADDPDSNKYQYVLEPLAMLKVAEAMIEGTSQEFSEKLSHYIMAKNRPILHRLQYRTTEVRTYRRAGHSKARKGTWTAHTRSLKKFWKPTWDWTRVKQGELEEEPER
ncbi:hypothetical protein NA57DRAFT_78946 [Rhizodiscina lignyota]|uniref:Uncharacterized protein n=1 Tax=Rhizodiscina lignyota TaxID=1504668 RepID=A0A9P4M3X6_9PEZI|nr:hypothetical protein NA57DRAFT_78946 [Rhizodiscina lignyota]